MDTKNRITLIIYFFEFILLIAAIVLVLYTVYISQLTETKQPINRAMKTITGRTGFQLKQEPKTVDVLLEKTKDGKEKIYYVPVVGDIPSTSRNIEYIREVISEHPEELGKYIPTLYEREGTLSYVQFTYDKKTEWKTKKTMEAVRKICDKARKENTKAKQIMSVVKQISDKCVYDKEVNDCESAYGCLIKGRAKCTGYAQSMQLCMKELDIPTRYVVNGRTDHIWNQIKIDGKWINIDVTNIDAWGGESVLEKKP